MRHGRAFVTVVTVVAVVAVVTVVTGRDSGEPKPGWSPRTKMMAFQPDSARMDAIGMGAIGWAPKRGAGNLCRKPVTVCPVALPSHSPNL